MNETRDFVSAALIAAAAAACSVPGGEGDAEAGVASSPEMRSAEPAMEADHFVPSTT